MNSLILALVIICGIAISFAVVKKKTALSIILIIIGLCLAVSLGFSRTKENKYGLEQLGKYYLANCIVVERILEQDSLNQTSIKSFKDSTVLSCTDEQGTYRVITKTASYQQAIKQRG